MCGSCVENMRPYSANVLKNLTKGQLCENAISSSMMFPRGRTLFRIIRRSVVKQTNESRVSKQIYLPF